MFAHCRRCQRSFLTDVNMSELDRYDFDLPEDLIALRPTEPRDACRLLKVGSDGIDDCVFRDLRNILRPGDLLIGNNTRVIPALLFGTRPSRDETSSDVTVQVNLLEALGDLSWLCLCKPGRRLKEGDRIDFPEKLEAHVVDKRPGGEIVLRFEGDETSFWTKLHAIGAMPIPPYIAKKRPSDETDLTNYQTVFADKEGSVAAPTAGLHFTDTLIETLKAGGVGFETVTLHVGAGTFAGLTDENLQTGRLHEEWFDVSADVLRKIAETKAGGGRVVAIGTTALRTLESLPETLSDDEGLSGTTDIFIRPGYIFKHVDALITNFHLPRSSLFMLVCALTGVEAMQNAYRHAVQEKYRFYSYGDACFLERSS